MNEILDFKAVKDYNASLGLETQHPLVAFVDFSRLDALPHRRARYGIYGVFLKEPLFGPLVYGRGSYDYPEGTLVFMAPGQVGGINDGGTTPNPRGYALLFHPDLLVGTGLARRMRQYTFFSYEVNEALHMSERERRTVLGCFEEIREELAHAVDRHSRAIVVANIEVLLNHCLRFYDRQFITRQAVNKDVLARFETLLADYFDSSRPSRQGLPSVAWCAGELHLSPNYFGDLVKKETGYTALECIHQAVISRVRELLLGTDKTVSEIAYETGFLYPHHLSRLFKRVTGTTPGAFRKQA